MKPGLHILLLEGAASLESLGVKGTLKLFPQITLQNNSMSPLSHAGSSTGTRTRLRLTLTNSDLPALFTLSAFTNEGIVTASRLFRLLTL